MSWMVKSPPQSPRAPKIQQQSWDDCTVPPIDLYDPVVDFYGDKSNCVSPSAHAKNSPAPRKINYNQQHLPYSSQRSSESTPPQSSGTPNYHGMSTGGTVTPKQTKSPKSPRHFDFAPISPRNQNKFDFQTAGPSQTTQSQQSSDSSTPGSCTSNRHYYDTTTTDVSPSNASVMLGSPRKYEYGAISPKYEKKGFKKFEYLPMTKPPANRTEYDEDKRQNEKILLDSVNLNTCDFYVAKKEERETGQERRKLNLATHHRNNSAKFKKKRAYNVSPEGVCSLDEYTRTITYDTTNSANTKRRMSITISDGDTVVNQTSVFIDDNMDATSLLTNSNSTNCSATTVSPSPSTSTGLSNATTATCSKNSDAREMRRKFNNVYISAESDDETTERHDGFAAASNALTKRRHAINITSNPGYQALHNSHSTLDRTCSDSVVSLKCHRKSTSDLTNDDSYRNDYPQSMTPISRRRGSKGGGLALLASRRSSRESVISQQTNVSNEDIGPLTSFQATQRGRQRRTSNFLELPVPDHARPRVCSLPERPYNPRQSDDLYRLRTFSISKGTVVNCGDSIISRRSRSNTSVNSTTSRLSERSPFEGSCCGGGYAAVDSMPPSPTDSDPLPPPRYRVVMLGDSGTGKTALVSQFMTSEYMHTYDASLDDEFGEKTVSVLLDGEESEMIFIDHPAVEMSVENSLSTYEPHACVIVYSIVARSSFRVAEEIVNYLWRENVTRDKAVILVGNKADLARSRVITTQEGKQLAASRESKFIETSSGIQHNVDELLVGILKQVRLKEVREKKQQNSSKMRSSKTHMSLHLAKEILQKICFSDISKSKSCENLHVL